MTRLEARRGEGRGRPGPSPSEARGFVAGNEPFFLVGSERSGTTLLRLMLSHHPRISCAPEFEFLVDRIGEDGRFPDMERYRGYLAANRVFRPHGLEVDPSLDYTALVRSFVAQIAAREGKEVHGVTCHHAFDHLPQIWPGARFVHLLRDGRDVARSCIGMGWAGNVWYGVRRWIDAQAAWNRLVDRIPEERLLEVRYEDLILRTEDTLERVCRFLGVELDPAVFDYAETSTYDRPDPSLVAQWRRKLSADELGLLEERIGPMLRTRGYEESGVPAARVSLRRRIGLYLDNRLRGFRFRSGRYGLRNVLVHYAARKLGLRDVERRMDLVRNDIDDRHLK